MGQEISDSKFDAAAFDEFKRRLDVETELLGDWLAAGRVQSKQRRFGFEMEGWLTGLDGLPAARNQAFLQQVDDPLVVHELARFNFEINSEPLPLQAGSLNAMHDALQARWRRCEASAAELGMRSLMIGILPTVRPADLSLRNMSPLQRYRAINDQIFALRNGEPIQLDIDGDEHLLHRHADVMLEAATTSLQIHIEVDGRDAARAFNISKMLSAVMVGISANSPFLFARRLWRETRIPLFEQAVAVGGSDYSKRVTFGVRYAQHSIFECFEANRSRYPVLLPDLMDKPVEELAHLRLHNGTIWRWNRPLIGFDESGEPHCRIEHRVVAAGPTPADAMANTALFIGLFEYLMRSEQPLEDLLPFAVVRDNFYAAARAGIFAQVRWLDGDLQPLQRLLSLNLLDCAAQGLHECGFDDRESGRWLDVIRGRISANRTGAEWQVAWCERHGSDYAAMVTAYADRQATNQPVHLWSLE